MTKYVWLYIFLEHQDEDIKGIVKGKEVVISY